MAQSYNPARNIKQNTIKRLYGLSGNVCANPDCHHKLSNGENHFSEIAHICAAKPNGPRYVPNMTDEERRSIDNLILLCDSCNKLVDSDEKKYSISLLKEWKKKHEDFVSSDIYNAYFQNIFAKQKEGALRKQEIDVDGKIYSSRIFVSQGETVLKEEKGIHCLADYLLSLAKDYKWEEYPDVFIQGIGGVGKSTEVKYAYNTFLDVFSDKKNYDDYNFFPIVYFFELKNFQKDFYKKFDERENIILFLDGLDEISGSNIVELVKYLNNIRSQFTNVRFVISGRQASFDSEINGVSQNKLLIELTDDFDPYEATNRKLIEKFQNSAILDVISIPFYRKYLEINKDISGYKDFFEKVVLYLLDKDKQKSDYANNIPAREKDKSSINREKIIEELSKLCYKTFCNGRIVFSEQELKESTQDDFLFVINSSLIKYSGPENISFASNLFFEYFLALFYLKNQSKLKKDLFLASGRLNVKYVNTVSIILNIAVSKAKIVSWLKKKLSKETNAFILLTDYRTLPPKTRYEYYKKIFEEFSKKGKNIYYLRWRSSFNCLSGVSALNKAMHKLIPTEYQENVLDYLLENVASYLNERIGSKAIRFTNAVIMLGLWDDNLWDKPQQEKLKKESVEILNVFLHDPLIKGYSKNFLSENAVLNWYNIFNWTDDWSASEWNDFLKYCFPNTQGFGTFANDEECHFQLELFNCFSNDGYIKLLAKPLCIEIMKKLYNDIAIADYVPNEIDDDYKPSYIHTDSEIYRFHEILKKGCFLFADDVVDIIQGLIDAHVDFHSSNYEFRELKKELSKIWLSQINSLSIDKVNDIYKIIACAMNESEDLSFYEIENGLKILPDEIKYSLLECILQKLDDLNWKYDWYFYGLITLLLDTTSESVKEKLEQVHRKISDDSYNSLVLKIYRTVEKNRPLYIIIKPIYEEMYAKDIQEENIRQKRLLELREKHIAKEINEANLIVNSSLILNEIDSVEKFVNDEYSEEEKESFSFFDLEYDQIEHNLRYDITNKKKFTIVFSSFVIKFLRLMSCNNSSDAFEMARNFVKNWFSDEKKYWRFFYDYYVCQYYNEGVEKFLAKDTVLRNKILDSMEIEICELQDVLNVQQVISLKGCAWVIPFVKYLHILLNDKLPSYIKKEKLLSLIAFPSIFVHSNTYNDFGTYESVFSWLQTVAGFSTERLVEKSIEFYPLVQRDDTKAQILSYLIKHIDLKEDIIFEIIYKETEKVLRKDYSNNEYDAVNHGPLAHFWEKADAKYLRKIFEIVPFERYDLRRENPCLREITDYSLKYMTLDEKTRLIKILEKFHNDGVQELLLRLGSKKEILKKIKGYLNGDKVEYGFSCQPVITFGFIKKDLRILWAYWRLFEYSMENESERCSVLFNIARNGIAKHLGQKTFVILKILMHLALKRRMKAGLHVDGCYDFIDEMEQTVYSR